MRSTKSKLERQLITLTIFTIIFRVRTALWAGDCFVYTNANNRLNYSVGGETFTIAHLDRQMYLLGYIPSQSRLYLVDKVCSAILLFSLLIASSLPRI